MVTSGLSGTVMARCAAWLRAACRVGIYLARVALSVAVGLTIGAALVALALALGLALPW